MRSHAGPAAQIYAAQQGRHVMCAVAQHACDIAMQRNGQCGYAAGQHEESIAVADTRASCQHFRLQRANAAAQFLEACMNPFRLETGIGRIRHRPAQHGLAQALRQRRCEAGIAIEPVCMRDHQEHGQAQAEQPLHVVQAALDQARAPLKLDGGPGLFPLQRIGRNAQQNSIQWPARTAPLQFLSQRLPRSTAFRHVKAQIRGVGRQYPALRRTMPAQRLRLLRRALASLGQCIR